MSYEKQNFKDGQVLTAEMLNKMEDGIANAGGSEQCLPEFIFRINVAYYDEEIITCDATYQQILEKITNNVKCRCIVTIDEYGEVSTEEICDISYDSLEDGDIKLHRLTWIGNYAYLTAFKINEDNVVVWVRTDDIRFQNLAVNYGITIFDGSGNEYFVYVENGALKVDSR